MKQPYIGITDFATALQVRRLADHLAELQHGVPTELRRCLMVGVMMNYETLYDLPSKWSGVWVPKQRLSEVFIAYPGIYNTLHYANYKTATIVDDLKAAVSYAGSNVHALQLDMTWPDVGVVAMQKEVFPHIDIILQVGVQALKKNDVERYTPMELVSRLRPYEPFVEYVLLDESSGTGKDMNAPVLLSYIDAIVDHLDMRVSAAGGIGPGYTQNAKWLLERHSYLSFDAQGKIRPSGSSKDPMDEQYGADYLTEMVAHIAEANTFTF